MVENINTADYWDQTYESEFRSGVVRTHPDVWPLTLDLMPAPGGTVVDVGCGTGEFIMWLAANTTSLSIFGADHSAFAVRRLNRHLETLGWPWGKTTAICASAYELRLGGECADVVYSGHLLEHLDDPVAALREQRRILKPGGRVIVHFPYKDEPYVEHLSILDFPLVEGWLVAAGFEIEGRSQVIPGQPTNDALIWGYKDR